VETPGFVGFSAQAISPDGRWLAFARVPPGQRTTDSNLWLRPVGSTQAVPLQGTDNPGSVFWSPDSRSIGFRSEGRLKRMDISTGVTTGLHAMPANLSGGTWGVGGEIIFSTNRMLYRASATEAREPIELLRPDQTLYLSFTFPEYLPDQRHVLFFAAATDPDRTGIYVVDSAATPATPIFVAKSDSAASYAEGRLLFVRDSALLAQPFDAHTRRTTGDPFAVVSGFANPGASGVRPFSIGANVLAYRAAARREAELAWYDRHGTLAGIAAGPGAVQGVRLSPDNRKLAYARIDPRTGQQDTWIIDLDTGVDSRLTNEPTGSGDRFWSPDGRSVGFWSRRKGKTDLYHHALGAREAELLYESPEEGKWLDDWLPGLLLFHMAGRLFSLPLEGERKPKLVVDSPPFIDQAQATRDGRFLAYGSNSSGRWEVYVAPMSAPDRRRQVSLNGGGQAHWRADGKELYYLATDGTLMSVTMKSEGAGGPPEFTAPTRLFQSPIMRPAMTVDEFDVTSDGKRFLFVRPLGDGADLSLTVSINWTSALKK
jgi:Tol biopolymer transport system component